MITLKTKLGNELSNKQLQLINWYPALKRYCRVITRNNWDGDDLAQETMVKMFKSYLGTESSNNKITLSLMYRIAYNHWIDQLRRGVKENKDVYIEPSYEPMKDLPEIYSIIEKLIQNLTPNQTIIFILKDVFEYSLADISQQLSMSEGSIKASLFRTRNRLKSIVEDNDEEDFKVKVIDGEDYQVFYRALFDSISKENPSILIELFRDYNKSKPHSTQFNSTRFEHQNLQLLAA